MKLDLARETWESVLFAAELELREYGHYNNNAEDDRRITAGAIRAALRVLMIEVTIDAAE